MPQTPLKRAIRPFTLKTGLLGILLAGAITLPTFAQELSTSTQQMAPLTAPLTDPRFAAAVRKALVDNPEIILEVFEKLEDMQTAKKQMADQDILAANVDALFGDSLNADHPVLVEFLDYNCGYCKRALGELAKAKKAAPDLEVIRIEFPILGTGSFDAARYALAVRNTLGAEAYEQVHNEFLALESQLELKLVEHLLTELGFDIEALRKAADAPEILQEIKDAKALAKALNINGTPGFVGRGEILRGAGPSDRLLALAQTRHVELTAPEQPPQPTQQPTQ